MSSSGQRDGDGEGGAVAAGDGATLPASGDLSGGDIGLDKTEASGDRLGRADSSRPGLEDSEEKVVVRTESSRDLTGKTLSERYSVLKEIGRGGMSVVYLARHELLNKTVAVKVLREEIAGHKDSLKRFHREARAAASIGDPHIVDVTDYGFTEQGDAFIVMELLEGQDLRALVRAEGALSPERTREIGSQILRALSAAHERGIVHRDLKGENVFITRREGADFIKLLDFGISKLVQPVDEGDSTGLTSTGQVLGTPQYLAPEQAHGVEKVDHRADIYAMGVILYEMLTGELPFSGKSVFEVLMKHAQEPPEPPSARRPELGIPADLERVALRALAKKPEERFASAGEMLAALRGAALDPPPPARRRPRALIIALAAVLGLGGVAVLAAVLGGRDRPAGPRVASRTVDGGSARPDLPRPAPDLRAPDGGAEQPAAKTVELEVVPTPATAQVFLDGKRLGAGRVSITLPRGDRPVRLRVSAPGHRTDERTLTLHKDTRLHVRLRRLRRRPGKPRDIKENPYE